MLVPILYAALALGAQPAQTGLAVQGCDLGEHYVFAKVDCQLEFENPTDAPITASAIAPIVSGDSSERNTVQIAPKSRAYLPVHIVFENQTGMQRHGFSMRTDEPDHPEIRVPVRGFAMSVLDEQPKVDFGVVDLLAPVQKHSVTLTSQEFAGLAVEKVLSKPAWIDASVDGTTVELSVRPDAPLGLHDDFVKLALNAPQQREVWILVNADLRGDVVPSANPLSLGLIRNSDDNEFRIVLTSRSDKKFALGAVEVDKMQGSVKLGDCVPAKAGCRWLTFKLAKSQPLGSIKGNLLVTLPDTKQKLKISVRGLLVDKSFEAKPLETKTADEAGSGRASSAPKEVDLAAAIKGSVEPEQLPPGNGPLLKWSVANGQLIHGFQVFRADAEQGPFTLLTANTIRGKATDATTEAYNFRDNTAESGKTYWYYIGTVYIDGHKQRLTTPQKVVAK